MIYNCLQKKGIRRKSVKKKYKQNITFCKSAFFCKSIAVLSFVFSVVFIWLQFIVCVIIGFFKLFPIWIYELFRFCPYRRRGDVKSDFLIIGHRGAAAYEIENTIPALEKAINNFNANALEIDLSITKDNEIVLWHDWDPDEIVAIVRQLGIEPSVKYRPFVPMSGMWRKPVNKLFLNELREYYGYTLKKGHPEKLNVEIPTLEDFLSFAKNQSKLNAVLLDIKIPIEDIELVALFAHLLSNLIEKHKPHFQIILLSPVKEILKDFKRYLPSFNISFDVELPWGIILDPNDYSSVKKAIKLNNSNTSIGRPTAFQLAPWTTYRRIIEYDVQIKNNFNQTNPEIPIEKLISWTINYKREMKCLLNMGVDGILTDKPDKLSKLLV